MRVVVGLALLGLTQSALAADLPYLRGAQYEEPIPVYRWSGVYGGGQVGYSVAGMDFTGGVRALVADEVRLLTIERDQHISDWPVLPRRNPPGVSFGGFVGYNWQWEDAVAGFEINYNRTSLTGDSSSSIERTFFDSNGLPTGHNYFYDVTVTGAASAHITDWATFRVRGAWAAGQFLPYGFVALAVGRTDISRSASVTGTATDNPNPPPVLNNGSCVANCPLPTLQISESESVFRKGVFAYGAAAGLGVDVALLPNVFLRGEWEWVQFAPVDGMHLHISTIRTALGFKF